MTTLFAIILSSLLWPPRAMACATVDLLPPQVCGTQDLTWAVLVSGNEGCPVALGHICYRGESPDPWTGVACCSPDGMCRIGDATDTCAGPSERLACRF
jgi:hypothetical protein